MKKLNELAQKNQLTPGMGGTEEEFEHLVETINGEAKTSRNLFSIFQQRLLDAARKTLNEIQLRQHALSGD